MLSGLVLVFITFVIPAFTYILLGACVMSVLLGFGVIRSDNRIFVSLYAVLVQITEPVLMPVRSMLPQFGAFDFSPVVVFLALEYLFRPALLQIYFFLIERGL